MPCSKNCHEAHYTGIHLVKAGRILLRGLSQTITQTFCFGLHFLKCRSCVEASGFHFLQLGNDNIQLLLHGRHSLRVVTHVAVVTLGFLLGRFESRGDFVDFIFEFLALCPLTFSLAQSVIFGSQIREFGPPLNERAGLLILCFQLVLNLLGQSGDCIIHLSYHQLGGLHAFMVFLL